MPKPSQPEGPTITGPSPGSRPTLPHADLADLETRTQWLAGVRSHVEDLVAAALDASAPPARRDLGRRQHRRIIVGAASALRDALDAVGAPDVASADAARGPSSPARGRSEGDGP